MPFSFNSSHRNRAISFNLLPVSSNSFRTEPNGVANHLSSAPELANFFGVQNSVTGGGGARLPNRRAWVGSDVAVRNSQQNVALMQREVTALVPRSDQGGAL